MPACGSNADRRAEALTRSGCGSRHATALHARHRRSQPPKLNAKMQPGKWRAMAKRRNDGDQLERRRSAGATATACSCPDFASAVVARLFAAATAPSRRCAAAIRKTGEESTRIPHPTNRLNSARGSHHTLRDRPCSTAPRISGSLCKIRNSSLAKPVDLVRVGLSGGAKHGSQRRHLFVHIGWPDDHLRGVLGAVVDPPAGRWSEAVNA